MASASRSALAAVDSALSVATAGAAQVELTLSAAPVSGVSAGTVVGSGAFDFYAGQGQEAIRRGSGQETLVVLPSSLYVHQAAGPTILPPGKSWVSAGLTESVLSTNFPQFVTQVEAVNPILLADEVSWGAVSAAPLGSVQINGAAADGYLAQVDLGQAATRAAGPSAAASVTAIGLQRAALDPGVSPGGSITLAVQVWIDGNGHLVRLTESPPGAGVGTVSATLSTARGRVRVSPPPPDQVVDVASLRPGGERESSGGGDSDGG